MTRQRGPFSAHSDANTEFFAYLEAYDNTHRKHSSLGHKTPAAFEAPLDPKN